PSGSDAGVGFAIPVDVVNRIVPELIRNGRVATPGIGIVAASEAITARLGIDGVAVVSTSPGSPAERAGLQGIHPSTGSLGEIIVAANGKPVHHLSDLTDQLEQVGVQALHLERQTFTCLECNLDFERVLDADGKAVGNRSSLHYRRHYRGCRFEA